MSSPSQTKGDEQPAVALSWNVKNAYLVLWEARNELFPEQPHGWSLAREKLASVVRAGSAAATLEEHEKKWLLALIAGAFVRGVDDAFLPSVLPGDKDVQSEQHPAWNDLPQFEDTEDAQKFFEFVSVKLPLWTKLIDAAGGVLKKRFKDQVKYPPTKLTPTIKFATLMRLEADWLFKNGEARAVGTLESAGVSREPWVRRPAVDRFGLCLSGGGIRSATFNLGLLQALGEKGVLSHLDYLSTVSGGGYIGGFWTTWLAHASEKAQLDAKRFPVRITGAEQHERERPEVRHLREFSRFLVPRVGFTQYETWTAVSAVLGGTLISLLVMGSAVALLFYAWFFAVSLLAGTPIQMLWNDSIALEWRCVLFGVLTGALHWVTERQTIKLGKLGEETGIAGYVIALVAGFFGGGCWWLFWSEWGLPPERTEQPEGALEAIAAVLDGLRELPTLVPSVVWIIAALALLLLRALLMRLLPPKYRAALERSIGRCLAPALLAGILAGIWCFVDKSENINLTNLSIGAGGFAALFVSLREWLKKPVEETNASALFGKLLRFLRPVLPQVAAQVAVGLFFLSVALFVHRYTGPEDLPALLWPAGIFGLSLLWFDPALTGLHEFYRGRLARCYLGAARAEPPSEDRGAPGAATATQDKDDLTLGQLRKLRQTEPPGSRRPLHLVCCAANNLRGDPLGSLYRGARSATVSPFGLSLGNFSAPRDELSFSSALTASAAAFNSQMGAISMKLGPAVAFVMCALNLRLGLWVPHPLDPRQRVVFPALTFLLEALGRSRSDQVWDREFFSRPFLGAVTQVHLSDGGHFENLGLYELVRRHCRHIIVSDASADPRFEFDDLANAMRRVREDFGVEIEINVDPLRPNPQGFSKQHAVIGTIHYDGLDGTDKGVIVYFKATLSGDEPVDVLQFRANQPTFPNDSTGDQFYDAAQWESYRRLGQHTAAVLVSISDESLKQGNYVDRLFLVASSKLQVVDQALQESFLELTDRCQSLMEDVRDNGPAVLRHEFFPEVATASGSAAPSAVAGDDLKVAYYVMMIAQTMEDVWLGVGLEERWAHPLNEGWMNYFQRWTSTPSFRTWWPILRPLFNPNFRDFVKERFNLRLNEAARGQFGPGARLSLRDYDLEYDQGGLAVSQLLLGNRKVPRPAFVYELELQDATTGKYLKAVQVGVLCCLRRAADEIWWSCEDLYVSPALNGSGIQSRFLDALIDKFGASTELHVQVEPTSGAAQSRSPAARQELVQRIAFYKSRGFQYDTGAGQTGLLIRHPQPKAA